MFGAPGRRAAMLRVAAIVSICMVALAACIPADAFVDPLHSPLPTPPTRVPGEDVPYTSLWQGEVNQICEGWTEVASLATTEEEYADIVALVSGDYLLLPSGFPSWESLDLGADEAVIRVWLGCSPGCEVDITTRSVIKTEEHALSINAEYGLWGPDKVCPAGWASIAQLLRVPWDGTRASETELSLFLYPAYR